MRYTAQKTTGAKPDFESLAGVALASGSADAVFEDLPESISSDKYTPESTRTRIAVAGDGRWTVAAQMLLCLKRYPDAARMLRQVLNVEDDALPAATFAIDHSEGPAAASAFLRFIEEEMGRRAFPEHGGPFLRRSSSRLCRQQSCGRGCERATRAASSPRGPRRYVRRRFNRETAQREASRQAPATGALRSRSLWALATEQKTVMVPPSASAREHCSEYPAWRWRSTQAASDAAHSAHVRVELDMPAAAQGTGIGVR